VQAAHQTHGQSVLDGLLTHHGALYIVHGGPGCGKTHYLREQVKNAVAKYGKSAVVALSYTRAAAAELRGRLDLPDRNVGTLHSLCFRALNHPTLAEGKITEWNDAHRGPRLTKKKRNIYDPLDEEGDKATLGDRLLSICELMRARFEDPATHVDDRVRDFWRRWKAWKAEAGYLDFTDLLETALHDLDTCPGDPAVLVCDEMQDSSRLQLALVLKWSRAAQTTVIAHDAHQAIYTWCGAAPDVLLDLTDSLPQAHQRRLPRTHRLPRAIHAVADNWLRHYSRHAAYDFAPRDADGVARRSNATWINPGRLIDRACAHAAAGKTVMFTAACRYFLSPLAAALRKQGIPYHNPWRAADAGFNPLRRGGKIISPCDRVLAFLRCDRDTHGLDARPWSHHDLWAWCSSLQAKGLLAHGGKEALKAWKGDFDPASPSELVDLIAPEARPSLEAVAFYSPAATKQALHWWLDRCLPKQRRVLTYPIRVADTHGGAKLLEEPRFIIGNVHSLKGSQADVVYFFPDLSRAGMGEWMGSPESKDRVRRVFYVGMTRAKEELVVCTASSAYHVYIPL
jgi:superfamily I DNA/RNA helicase